MVEALNQAEARILAHMARPLAVALALVLAAPSAPVAVGDARAEQTRPSDPRTGDPEYERAQRLFDALAAILDEAARERLDRQIDPDGALEDFARRQFGMDQSSRIRQLLATAFEMTTDAPVVDIQRAIEAARREIATMRGQIAELRERRIAAPTDDGWSSWLGVTEDKRTITDAIEELEARIGAQQGEIAALKGEFADAMTAAGAPLSQEQVDLLLESVTGGDLVALAAAYEAVRGVSEQLRALMDENGEDLAYAKRYYGMHTSLIALLVEAHSRFLRQIEEEYLPKLEAIEDDILEAAAETRRLLVDRPTPEQRRALEANAASQRVALDALRLYRDYLKRQRSEIAAARRRAVKELRVADNTLRTVDASYQLRQIMDSAAASFEALRSLESPGFERLFRNEELRREFQSLTNRLAPGS